MNGPKEKPSARERWARIVSEAYATTDDHAKDVLDASREDIDRELEEAGFDLKEEEELARKAHEAFLAKRRLALPPEPPSSAGDIGGRAEGWVADAAPSNVVPLTPRKSTARWLVYALVAAAATGGTVFAVARHGPPPPEEPPPPPKAPNPPPVVEEPPPAPAPPPETPPTEDKMPKAPPRHPH